MRLTASARDFFAGETWLTAVNVTPAGSVSSAYSVWAGGGSLLLPGTLADTCNDWTSTLGSASTGLVTGTSPASHFYYNPQGNPCSQASVLLTCLEE